ncbi:MAG TPA: hypothetical protein VHM47_06230 [Actinomycetota bacterium]|nr:hypothetical protein [Actinomycetota bacterium]
MKVDVSRRAIVLIGKHGMLPPLIDETAGPEEVLVLAIGPHVTPEQKRVVEEAISVAFERRVPFEARIVAPAEALAVLGQVRGGDTVRTHGFSRRELRRLRAPRR